MDNNILEQFKQLSTEELLETYNDIEEHINYLNESIIDQNESGDQNG
jgi:hypothetical protein